MTQALMLMRALRAVDAIKAAAATIHRPGGQLAAWAAFALLLGGSTQRHGRACNAG